MRTGQPGAPNIFNLFALPGVRGRPRALPGVDWVTGWMVRGGMEAAGCELDTGWSEGHK